MTPKSYPIYKGLQKPLTYKGFKGKYIYWALGSLILGLLVGAVATALTNMIISGLSALASMGSCIAFILYKQNQGLYNRNIYSGIFVHQSKLSIYYEKRKQEPI